MVGEQYPDKFKFQDTQGVERSFECRFRPVKGTVFLKKQDGTEIQCSFDIAFPVETPSIPLGVLFNGENERGQTFVNDQELLAFHVGAYNCQGRC